MSGVSGTYWRTSGVFDFQKASSLLYGMISKALSVEKDLDLLVLESVGLDLPPDLPQSKRMALLLSNILISVIESHDENPDFCALPVVYSAEDELPECASSLRSHLSVNQAPATKGALYMLLYFLPKALVDERVLLAVHQRKKVPWYKRLCGVTESEGVVASKGISVSAESPTHAGANSVGSSLGGSSLGGSSPSPLKRMSTRAMMLSTFKHAEYVRVLRSQTVKKDESEEKAQAQKMSTQNKSQTGLKAGLGRSGGLTSGSASSLPQDLNSLLITFQDIRDKLRVSWSDLGTGIAVPVAVFSNYDEAKSSQVDVKLSREEFMGMLLSDTGSFALGWFADLLGSMKENNGILENLDGLGMSEGAWVRRPTIAQGCLQDSKLGDVQKEASAKEGEPRDSEDAQESNAADKSDLNDKDRGLKGDEINDSSDMNDSSVKMNDSSVKMNDSSVKSTTRSFQQPTDNVPSLLLPVFVFLPNEYGVVQLRFQQRISLDVVAASASASMSSSTSTSAGGWRLTFDTDFSKYPLDSVMWKRFEKLMCKHIVNSVGLPRKLAVTAESYSLPAASKCSRLCNFLFELEGIVALQVLESCSGYKSPATGSALLDPGSPLSLGSPGSLGSPRSISVSSRSRFNTALSCQGDWRSRSLKWVRCDKPDLFGLFETGVVDSKVYLCHPMFSESVAWKRSNTVLAECVARMYWKVMHALVDLETLVSDCVGSKAGSALGNSLALSKVPDYLSRVRSGVVARRIDVLIGATDLCIAVLTRVLEMMGELRMEPALKLSAESHVSNLERQLKFLRDLHVSHTESINDRFEDLEVQALRLFVSVRGLPMHFDGFTEDLPDSCEPDALGVAPGNTFSGSQRDHRGLASSMSASYKQPGASCRIYTLSRVHQSYCLTEIKGRIDYPKRLAMHVLHFLDSWVTSSLGASVVPTSLDIDEIFLAPALGVYFISFRHNQLIRGGDVTKPVKDLARILIEIASKMNPTDPFRDIYFVISKTLRAVCAEPQLPQHQPTVAGQANPAAQVTSAALVQVSSLLNSLPDKVPSPLTAKLGRPSPSDAPH